MHVRNNAQEEQRTKTKQPLSLDQKRIFSHSLCVEEPIVIMSHCCPPNAWKFLAPDYNTTGSLGNVGGVDVYTSGSSTVQAVVLIPDIFGWNGGRTRNIADFLADEGYYVVVPKLLIPALDGAVDGDGFPPDVNWGTFFKDVAAYNPEALKNKISAVVDHIKARGIAKIHILGFCWGGWVAAHVLSDPSMTESFASCAIGHPSIHLEQLAWSKDNQELISRVTKPMLWLPCKGDPEAYHESGDWFAVLKKNNPTSETYVFPEVDHGFIPRGDLAVEMVKSEVDRALGLIVAFYNKH